MSPQRQHISKASTITYSTPQTRAMGRVIRAMMPQMMNEMGLQTTIVERVIERERGGKECGGKSERKGGVTGSESCLSYVHTVYEVRVATADSGGGKM